MKIVSFSADGKDRYGVFTGNGVRDAGESLGSRYADVGAVLEKGALAELDGADGKEYALDEIIFRFPVPSPDKIFCAGRNYREYHEVIEDGGAPTYPSIFLRLISSFAPHNGALLKPKVSDELDYENELAVIIGKPGRYVEAENAYAHVAGYTILNEGTVRDWRKMGTQNVPSKNFPQSGSIGPWMVTADELGLPDDIRITTRRNGEVVQDGSTEMMIYDIPYLIAHISKFAQLEPGDMIATGSPGGSITGMPEPKPWLKAGDKLEFEIEGIGVLENTVENE